jgi:hypothetical protein
LIFRKTRNRRDDQHKPLALKRNSSGTAITGRWREAASGNRRVANMKRIAVQQQAAARNARKHSKSETVTGCIRSATNATLPRQRAAVLLSPGAERLQWQWSKVARNPLPANRLPENPPPNQ